MNLNDLYEMRDPRDAYRRDVDNSQVGMGQRSRADVTGEEEPSGVFTVVINGKPWKTGSSNEMFALASRVANKHTDKKVAVKWPTGELNLVKPQGVAEGYYDLPNQDDFLGMTPIDFSSNPSFKELVTRYTQLVYQGHASETSPEEDQEHDAIEQYVAKRFGEKGSAHLQKAAEVSYWGRDDGKGHGHLRGDNLGYASMPGGKFRTTKSGKMHGQDVKMMKNKVADRLGRHPEPALPEGVEEGTLRESDSPVTSAITRRIIHQHPEVLAKYGPAIVGQAIDEVADFVGDVEEIGSSDVSGWVSQVIRSLGRFAPVRDESVAEGSDHSLKKVWDRYSNHLMAARGDHPDIKQINKSGEIVRNIRKYVKDHHGQKALDDMERYAEKHQWNESVTEDIPAQDAGEYDYEGEFSKDQLNTIVRAARRLDGMLDDNENMPEWVQMKITKAADQIDAAADYIESTQEPELDEGERGRGRPSADEWDTTPVAPGRVEKTATGIRHHADPSRYGGTEPDAEDDHLMSKSHISKLGKMTEPDIDEGEKVGHMDADRFDAALSRIKQLAGAGPMKTVWDPAKRVYKNVPTAVQPKK
jgi:hypothetical protein